MLIKFILPLFCIAIVSARLGGWEVANPKSTEVLQAVAFALNKKYADISIFNIIDSNTKIVDAKKQMVAGVLYDLIIEFTPPGKPCEVDHFQVGDRFGTLDVFVSEKLTNSCSV